jgi:hypothetical protein
MLSVPGAVLTELVASSRSIACKAIFHFSGGAVTYTGADFIMSFSSMEEESYESSHVYGQLSSNECSIQLLNTDRRFSVTNTSSPLYGKLVANVKVELFTVVAGTDVPVGVFYTLDWPVSATGMSVEVVCRDRLYKEAKTPLANSKVFTNITVNNALIQLFTAAGVSNYSIESGLNYVIPYWYYAGSSLGEELQRFVDGYGCRIYMNKSDIIQVKRSRATSVVDTFTGANQIMTLSGASEARYLFSKVDLMYNKHSEIEEDILDAELVIGSNKYNFVDTVIKVLYSTGNASITSILHDNRDIDITAASAGLVMFKGTVLDTVQASHVKQDSTLFNAIGEKVIKLYSDIIQDAIEAENFCSFTLSKVALAENYITVEARGNVALELGDRISINNNATKTVGNYYITKIKYEYTGGLQAEYSLVKG